MESSYACTWRHASLFLGQSHDPISIPHLSMKISLFLVVMDTFKGQIPLLSLKIFFYVRKKVYKSVANDSRMMKQIDK